MNQFITAAARRSPPSVLSNKFLKIEFRPLVEQPYFSGRGEVGNKDLFPNRKISPVTNWWSPDMLLLQLFSTLSIWGNMSNLFFRLKRASPCAPTPAIIITKSNLRCFPYFRRHPANVVVSTLISEGTYQIRKLSEASLYSKLESFLMSR